MRLFHRASSEASHQLFLENNQENDQGQKGNNCPRQRDIDLVKLGRSELLQADLDGSNLIVIAADQEGPEVLIPGAEERKDCQGCNDGSAQGEDDSRQEPDVPIAIQESCFAKFWRQREEGLAKEEDAKAGGQEWDR